MTLGPVYSVARSQAQHCFLATYSARIILKKVSFPREWDQVVVEHGRALEAHVESFAPRLCFFKGVFFLVWYLTCELSSTLRVLGRTCTMAIYGTPFIPIPLLRAEIVTFVKSYVAFLIIVSYISPNAIHQLLGLHREGIDPSKIEKIPAASRNPLLTGKIPFAISIPGTEKTRRGKPRTQRKWYRYSQTARP